MCRILGSDGVRTYEQYQTKAVQLINVQGRRMAESITWEGVCS